MRHSVPASDDPLAAYAGRWVACIGSRVVGQGGTPEEAMRAASAARHKEKPQVFFVPYPAPARLPDLFERVALALPSGQPAYLVGGAVRDYLLGRTIHDVDIVVPGDVMNIARQTARSLDAAFFPLDPERGAVRLFISTPDGGRQVLDITALRGPDLENDLRGRDFTINAIAMDLRSQKALYDPLGGAVDLHARQLRVCSPSSIVDDPLRILRAVRLAASLNLHILPETRQLLKDGMELLPAVSNERLRDELFNILDGPQPSAALRALEMLGVFPPVFPELALLKGVEQSAPHIHDVWNHTLNVIQSLSAVLDALQPEYDQESAASFSLGLVSVQLGRYREQLADHFSTSLNPQRTLRALLFFAALYHDIAKPQTKQVEASGRIRFFKHDQEGALLAAGRGRGLRLSNDEVDRLGVIVRHHLRPILLAQSGTPPSRRAIYRFFRDTGPAGVDICLLSLADVLGTYGPTLPPDLWQQQLEVIRALLESWWDHQTEKISPPPVLNGKDVMEAFSVKPGPRLGRLLEALREAQATGQVSNRQEGLDYLAKILSKDVEDQG
jgi:tRNA nucleotidyltransferase/poly(A) polymerase